MDQRTLPQKPTPSLQGSRPVMKHVHSSGHYQHGTNLQNARLAVLADLGVSVPQVSFQDFLGYLAPPQPSFNLHDTMELLKSGNRPTISSSGRWSTFPKDPNDAQQKEDAVFNPIPDIFTEVVAAVAANSSGALEEKNSTVCFVQNPNQVPVSRERRTESRPDGYFVLNDHTRKARKEKGKTHWADIALPCEYKVKGGRDNRDDDVRKVTWSMQHTMRDYASRRATFGMTIENTATRVWFCCRSNVIVSEAFNFIEEPDKLVKLFAAFAFADEMSLGFDPTIQPVPGDNEKLVITVQHENNFQSVKKFQTVRTISSYGAEPLRGRGTRIFEAVELDGNGKPTGPHVVLKDFWIDDDRVREGEILSLLLEKADPEDKKFVRKHFLTTVTHGDVWMGPNIRDDTANCLMRGLVIDPESSFELQHTPVLQDKPPPGSQSSREMSRVQFPHPNRIYGPKTHYRIVFKEICKPIDTISSLPEVLDVLIETVSALQLLRKLGWVHRDVSTGNILTYGGQAKLSDLEYAKKTGESISHEMRTGTMQFMSIEVAAHGFLFRPQRAVTLANRQQPSRQDKNPAQAGQTGIPFTHNHLHDLESLWWVAVWFLFYHRFSKEGPSVPSATFHDTEQRIELAQTLFPFVVDSATRNVSFQNPGMFQEKYCQLPKEHQMFGAELEFIRELLITQYKVVEAGLPQSINLDSSSDQIYNDFKTIFSELKPKYVGTTLEYLPNIHKELSKVEKAKRRRSESTNDPEGASASKSIKTSQKT